MPMTPAERQRNYRERLKQNDPEKYEEIRKRNLERVKSRYVKISKLPESQQKKRRRDWRRLKNNQKNKIKETGKKTSSRKLYLNNYYKLKKIIKKQKKKLEIQRKKIAALKKKCYRQKMLFECQKRKREESTEENDTTDLTPNSKAELFLKDLSSVSTQDKKKIKKALLDHNILTESIAKQYAAAKMNTERNIIKRLCCTELAHRYKVRTRLGRSIGLVGRIRFSKKNKNNRYSRIAKKILEFYKQDDVSRPSAGKNETKTFKKQKKQKRYLLDTMTNLHKKFNRDTGLTICYSTFIKYKPFYIVKPRLSDRDTCVCKVHANMKLKFIALKQIKILNSYGNLNDLVQASVCDDRSKECMYSECEVCNGTPIDYNLTETDQEAIVSWIEWSSTNVQYKKNNEIKTSKRILPVLKSDKLKNLIACTEAELRKFKEHLFNISHQYKSYKNLKENLEHDELVIHCDFSENYTCKMHEEIQAVHFGASQYQISLHTSVAYIKNERPKSYCTLSDSTNHSPEGIWAHLRPVLTDLKQMYPDVAVLHVYSDGPTVQYKQKKNFFLFKRYINELGFEKGTWNFSESYHGKGPADGVGANIKRLLDEKVSHGRDVRSALDALNLLEGETKVKLFCIDDKDIHEIESNNQKEFKSLLAVPNTLKIHQVQLP
ncbi:hypothetical protein B5X24_HaOG211720 [Helicoverpa armigera]|nr:hypothetical protein B5X24_HaOG211720 [Helicoverpa armigera]